MRWKLKARSPGLDRLCFLERWDPLNDVIRSISWMMALIYRLFNNTLIYHFAQACPKYIIYRFTWWEVHVLDNISTVDEGRVYIKIHQLKILARYLAQTNGFG
jgi:hypothetical protein